MHPTETVELNEKDTQRLLVPCLVEWMEIASRMQRLSWDILADASNSIDPETAAPPHRAAHYLCVRLNDELRAVVALTERGFVIQALSLAAGMLEFAFTVGWIGRDLTRGNDWLTWDNRRTIPPLRVEEAIRATYQNGKKDFSDAQVKSELARYHRLCELKHGNPAERRQYGIDLDFRGLPNRIVGDRLSAEFVDASRWVLWLAVRYLWLGTCCYNDFHASKEHHKPREIELQSLRPLIHTTRERDEAATRDFRHLPYV